jgi:hypothetical protein
LMTWCRIISTGCGGDSSLTLRASSVLLPRKANWGGEGLQRGQETGAHVAQHTHHLGLDRLQRICVGLHSRAQRAGQGSHPIRHLLYEHLTVGGRCDTIRHALLLGGTGCCGKRIVPPSGGALNALSIHVCIRRAGRRHKNVATRLMPPAARRAAEAVRAERSPDARKLAHACQARIVVHVGA